MINESLKEQQVKLEQIYLDPNNPRFYREKTRLVSESRLCDESVQEKTLETQVSATTNTEPEPPSSPENNIIRQLSKPVNLMVIIIVVLFIAIISALVRRRSPTLVQPQVSGRFCAECGGPIKAGESFCRSCGKRLD